MPSLRDSGKIIGSPASIKLTAQQCGLAFPLSMIQFLHAAGCPFSHYQRLHIKVLMTPDIPLATMLEGMREVYSTAGIRIELASREVLTGPAFAALLDVDVGSCDTGTVTAEQTQIFQYHDSVGANEIVVYFVQSVMRTVGNVGGLNGCASHPAGQFGAVIAHDCSPWTLAHEIGHVLGLNHIMGENAPDCTTPDVTRLMTGCSTDNIIGIPTISQAEINTMISSPLTHQS
jgi:hypothetical protein